MKNKGYKRTTSLSQILKSYKSINTGTINFIHRTYGFPRQAIFSTIKKINAHNATIELLFDSVEEPNL